MGKLGPWLMLGVVSLILVGTSFASPDTLNDENAFLANFVSHELLATLGFIVAVTLASSASLHLELNKLEDCTGRTFVRTRASVRKCAYSLLALLAVAVCLAIGKPLLDRYADVERALANSAAILVLFFSLHVLYALTRTVFAIPTAAKMREMQSENSTAP